MKIAPVAYLALVLLTLAGLAATPAVLEEAKAGYEKARLAALENAGKELRERLRANYTKAVERELDAATKSGKLEQSLALKSETERAQAADFSVPSQDPPDTPANLTKLRDVWRKEMARIQGLERAAASSVEADFADRLQKLEVQLTKERKLEEALAVRDYRLTLSKAPASADRATVANDEGFPVPLARPGRLRAAGWLKAGKPVPMQAAGDFADFVRVICFSEDQWAALRSNGEVITSAGQTYQNVKYIQGFNGILAMTLQDGSFLCNGSWPLARPPAGSGPFRYVTVGYGPNFLGLQNDGKAVYWGPNYQPVPEGTKPNRDHHFVPPPANQLTSVRAVAAGYQHASVITDKHELLCWTCDGPIPKAKAARGLVRLVTGKHYKSLALTEEGKLLGIEDDSGAVRVERDKVKDCCLDSAINGGYLFQERNGSWHHLPETNRENHQLLLDVLKDMSSSQFAASFSTGADGRTITSPCFVIWIEPADALRKPVVPVLKPD